MTNPGDFQKTAKRRKQMAEPEKSGQEKDKDQAAGSASGAGSSKSGTGSASGAGGGGSKGASSGGEKGKEGSAEGKKKKEKQQQSPDQKRIAELERRHSDSERINADLHQTNREFISLIQDLRKNPAGRPTEEGSQDKASKNLDSKVKAFTEKHRIQGDFTSDLVNLVREVNRETSEQVKKRDDVSRERYDAIVKGQERETLRLDKKFQQEGFKSVFVEGDNGILQWNPDSEIVKRAHTLYMSKPWMQQELNGRIIALRTAADLIRAERGKGEKSGESDFDDRQGFLGGDDGAGGGSGDESGGGSGGERGSLTDEDGKYIREASKEEEFALPLSEQRKYAKTFVKTRGFTKKL